jgi:small subunit ribosomal protein S2
MAKTVVSLKELLEAGVHFGHQVKRWNPKMKPFIYCVKDNIHIFDLAQTAERLKEACQFIRRLGSQGGVFVFVGVKRQAKKIVREEAERCGAKYVDKRWIGGLLTNFDQVVKNIKTLAELKEKKEAGEFASRTKKEQLLLDREIARLEGFYGGLETLKEPPSALFIIDARAHGGVIKEAKKRGVSVVAVCDSNADPKGIDFLIPGNDDATKAIQLFCKLIADAYLEGRQAYDKREKKGEQGVKSED